MLGTKTKTKTKQNKHQGIKKKVTWSVKCIRKGTVSCNLNIFKIIKI